MYGLSFGDPFILIGSGDSLKSFVGRSCMVFGLPLRFVRMWPLSSMLAQPEKDLNTSRVNLGEFARQPLGGVKEKAEVNLKGRRMGGSLVGATRKGKQGRKVSGLELLLIRPPTRRATSCIQLVSRSFYFFWRWVAMAHNFTCPCCLAVAARNPLSLLESFDRESYPRVSILHQRHGPLSYLRCSIATRYFYFFPKQQFSRSTIIYLKELI